MRTFAPSVMVLLAAACATPENKYAPAPTTWSDASASSEPSASIPATPKPVTRTAADVASEANSASLCLDVAKLHPADAGVAILRECMHRRDFLDLGAILQEPWLPHVRANVKLQARAVEVIARRGGFLEADLVKLARAGVPLRSLDQALAKPDAMRGALVVVRGTVEGVRSEKWGNRTGLVATIEETSWLEAQLAPDAPAPTLGDVERGAVERTGRKIFVRIDKREQLKRAAEVVVLMTFEAPRKTSNEAGDEEDTGIGMIAAAFDAGQSLRE